MVVLTMIPSNPSSGERVADEPQITSTSTTSSEVHVIDTDKNLLMNNTSDVAKFEASQSPFDGMMSSGDRNNNQLNIGTPSTPASSDIVGSQSNSSAQNNSFSRGNNAIASKNGSSSVASSNSSMANQSQTTSSSKYAPHGMVPSHIEVAPSTKSSLGVNMVNQVESIREMDSTGVNNNDVLNNAGKAMKVRGYSSRNEANGNGSSSSRTLEELHVEPAVPPYTGYVPLSPRDLLEDRAPFVHADEKYRADRTLINDDGGYNAKIHWLLVVLLCVCLLIALTGLILVSTCVVLDFCETNDASSLDVSAYKFKTLLFRVPSAMLWIGIVAGFLGLFVTSVKAAGIYRRRVQVISVLEVANLIRYSGNSFIAQHYVVLLFPVLALVLGLGLGLNWRIAACFGLGAHLGVAIVHVSTSAASRGQTRLPAPLNFTGEPSQQTKDSSNQEALSLAHKSSLVCNLIILSSVVTGLSSVYLLLNDVQALAGFAAGTSLVAFFMSTSSGIFTAGTNLSADDTGIPTKFPQYHLEASSGLWISVFMSTSVGNIMRTGSGLLSSIACAVVGTAIIGSGLPFFYRNSYALCIYNHLQIDQECGPLGDAILSYATYICRNQNLYMEYPVLETWSSSSIFVAVPFLLASIGLLICTTLAISLPKPWKSWKLCKTPGTQQTEYRCSWVRIAAGYLLFVAASAALIFGLLGPNSAFGRNKGFGAANDLPRMTLNGLSNQCVSTFINTEMAATADPYPIPSGAVLTNDRFKPYSFLGRLGSPHTIAWRLFGCALLGVVLSLVQTVSRDNPWLSRKCTDSITGNLQNSDPGKALSAASWISLLITITSLAFGGCTIGFAFLLSGPYGVGVMALSYMSSDASRVSFEMMKSITEAGQHIERVAARLDRRMEMKRANESVGIPSGVPHLSMSSVLASIMLLFAMGQVIGSMPSPEELVGSIELAPQGHITTSSSDPISGPQIVWSVIAGILIPLAIVCMLSSFAARTSGVIRTKHKNDRNASVPLFASLGRPSLLCGMIILMFIAAIITGHGLIFGYKQLLYLEVALVVAALLVGCFLANFADYWASALAQVPLEIWDTHNVHVLPWWYRFASNCLGTNASAVLLSSGKMVVGLGLVIAQMLAADMSKAIDGVIVIAVFSLLLVLLLIAQWKIFKREDCSAFYAEATASLGKVSPFFGREPEVGKRSARDPAIPWRLAISKKASQKSR